MARVVLRLVWSASWASGDDARWNRIYEKISVLGSVVAEAEGFVPCDEWQSLAMSWLFQNRPEICDRGITEDDVRDAFAAWQVGWRR